MFAWLALLREPPPPALFTRPPSPALSRPRPPLGPLPAGPGPAGLLRSPDRNVDNDDGALKGSAPARVAQGSGWARAAQRARGGPGGAGAADGSVPLSRRPGCSACSGMCVPAPLWHVSVSAASCLSPLSAHPRNAIGSCDAPTKTVKVLPKEGSAAAAAARRSPGSGAGGAAGDHSLCPFCL